MSYLVYKNINLNKLLYFGIQTKIRIFLFWQLFAMKATFSRRNVKAFCASIFLCTEDQYIINQ